MARVVACVLLLSAARAQGGYGAEPWVSWSGGSPVAPPGAAVTTAHARFTVLTARLLRLEFSPDGVFEDARSFVVWNRNSSAQFTQSANATHVTIDTGALLLEYAVSAQPFSAANLRVTRRAAAFWPTTVWTPELTPGVDAGQLFGTFHTVDGHSGADGGLNCSLLDPSRGEDDVATFMPCDMGLLSKSGFALVDDSRTPVWDEATGWLRARAAGGGVACPAASAPVAPCFPPAFDTDSAALCAAAGCCVTAAPTQLNLYYSASREDYFTDNLQCSACGSAYTFLHAQGAAWPAPAPGLVPLNLYWNAAPGARNGAGGDNVDSSFPPAQAGYNFVRVQGYVGDPALPQPADTLALKLWYSSALLDHWTTSSAADEAAAAAAGYALVGLVGYASTAPAPTPAAFRCAAPDAATSRSDAYLFAHGDDYKAAVRDYVAVAGQVPIPRRSWLGVSWSTWDESNTQALTGAQLANLSAAGFPLDTYIFDMQWHKQPAWGGYEWDAARYPDVPALLAGVHAQGLATGANLHDADGITQAANPTLFPAVAAALGLPAGAAGAPFDIGNKTYADVLAGVVLAPLQKQGIDLLWTDFQQGFPGNAPAGVGPTAVLNHFRFYNGTQAGMRGTQHSRYAGRGDHRHASAFGGDVVQSWDSLVFLVEFTKTAANAPLCYWGHEMMRQGGGIDDNSELFARVNQFGAWSPIFTSWGNSGQNNLWWNMPEPFASAVRESLRDRNQLLPYRYSAAAAAHATGVCAHRGMHFDFAGEPDAYQTPGQFLLGADLVVAPATAPVSPPIPPGGGGAANGTTAVPVWVPPGAWVDFASPTLAFSAGWTTVQATIFDVPVLARAGAIIPLLPRNYTRAWGAAARQYDALVFRRMPGGGSARAAVYEDDGLSTAYLSGATAETEARGAPGGAGGRPRRRSVQTTGGGYAGLVRQRAYTIETGYGAQPPARVAQDGAALPQSAVDGVPGTWFQADDHTAIYLLAVDTLAGTNVTVCQE